MQISAMSRRQGSLERSYVTAAIYTRKSSSERLDSEFNSLDAQREACGAYIASQAGEGWKRAEISYEDGGHSGGSLDRPALRNLLKDVTDNKIQVIVVYKIDRLTRSLTDFAKLVELFDRAGAKFVSVTQAFNTTTSMGRLTLNTLLSFAQFEREIASERIRDKKEAATRKGLFVGGMSMLGYDLKDRKLVVNEVEAETVRYMFRRYLELRSTSKLLADLNASGYRPKQFVTKSGKKQPAQTWYSSNVIQMLRNRRYVGEVKWGNQHYPGVHAPIVGLETFDAVQRLLDETIIPRRAACSARMTRLLSGLLYDDLGCRMISRRTGPAGNHHWGNYVSYSRLHKHSELATLTIVRVSRIEPVVLGIVQQIVARMGPGQTPALTHSEQLLIEKRHSAHPLEMSVDRRLVLEHVDRVILSADKVMIAIKPSASGHLVGPRIGDDFSIIEQDGKWYAVAEVSLGTGSAFRRIEFPKVEGAAPLKPRFNKALLSALHSAHLGKAAIDSGRPVRLREIAAAAGMHHRNYYRLLQLAYLAPDIQELILRGQQPQSMTVDTFLRNRLPMDWQEQREAFGLVLRSSTLTHLVRPRRLRKTTTKS